MKVAENGGISPRGAYKKPARERAKRQTRCLIVDEGLSNQQISERLNIPLRTVERYVADIYTSDSQVMQACAVMMKQPCSLVSAKIG
jgi:hypothetical protein